MSLSLDHSTSLYNSTSPAITKLDKILLDIAEKIQIANDLSITHPEHQPLELPPKLQERLGQISAEILHNYLRVKLQQFLHYIYYVSQPRTKLEEQNREGKIENQAIKWSKSDFVQQLRQNNHSEGHFEPGWLIVGETDEGFLQVKKAGLTLHIRSDRHLQESAREAKIGELVAVKMPSQLVEPGYFISVSTAGSINDLEPLANIQIVDLHFNLTAEGAVIWMEHLTRELNQIQIPFHFKVLYHPEDYIYADTAILSLVKDDYVCVQPIISKIYQKHHTYFQSEIPLFNKYLAPGLSIAERPTLDTNLAQHRFQLIATALVEAWQQSKTTAADKLEYISDRLAQAGINLHYPYLNPDSEDIYVTIDN